MPKENFYPEDSVEGDEPGFTVTWGELQPGVIVSGAEFGRSGLNRLIRTLRTARDKTFGADA